MCVRRAVRTGRLPPYIGEILLGTIVLWSVIMMITVSERSAFPPALLWAWNEIG